MKKNICRILLICLLFSVLFAIAFASEVGVDASSSSAMSEQNNSSDTTVPTFPYDNGSETTATSNAGLTDSSTAGISGSTTAIISTTVVDIDIDYQSSMTVGSTQVLVSTAIYSDGNTSADSKYTYSSNKKSVATVNAIGRITAIKTGTVKISVTCNGYTKKITIEIKKEATSEGVSVVKVKDLDFGDYEAELEVGKTLALSVTVIPSTATDQTISYSSSNTKVATVNGNGRVTGVSSGKVKITAKCGGCSKTITLTVKVKTEGITVDESYLVLKPSETHQINATVTPANAPNQLTFTSSDKSVATVSNSGLVTAMKSGNCSIVVSNGDAKVVISVIVNQNTDNEIKTDASDVETQEPDISNPILLEIESAENGKEIFVYQKDMDIISSDILKSLYGTTKKLTVVCDKYYISITGSDIKNIDNPLQTNIHLSVNEKEATFSLNDSGNNLPGSVAITFDDTFEDFKWLYSYNNSLAKWQALNSYSNNTAKVDSQGQYMLRIKKMFFTTVQWVAIIFGISVIVVGSIFYIVLKKQYWFW